MPNIVIKKKSNSICMSWVGPNDGLDWIFFFKTIIVGLVEKSSIHTLYLHGLVTVNETKSGVSQ